MLVGLTPTKPALAKGWAPLYPSRRETLIWGHGDVDLPTKPAQPIFVPRPKPLQQTLPSVPVPGPSRMSTSLATLRRTTSASSYSKPTLNSAARSTSFSCRVQPGTKEEVRTPRLPSEELEVEDKTSTSRDEDHLTIIENLMPGPKTFGRDPEGEEEWLHLEPNSSIRLSYVPSYPSFPSFYMSDHYRNRADVARRKRLLPHFSVQEHLSGRYHLPASLLYSVIRLSRDGATYEVPVDGDWVVIAVVAERGEVKVGGLKEQVGTDEDEDEERVTFKSDARKDKGNVKDVDRERAKEKWRKRRGPRKYINLKLCALPPRNRSSSTATTGDALLQLLLFESDAVVHEEKEGGNGETKRSYRGGSGGAYERWCNLGEGSVIAVLNPRVLRPLRVSTSFTFWGRSLMWCSPGRKYLIR